MSDEKEASGRQLRFDIALRVLRPAFFTQPSRSGSPCPLY